MNDDRNQGRELKPQAEQTHPDEWQRDLNPHHLAGQNIGAVADGAEATRGTAFHLRKRGSAYVPKDKVPYEIWNRLTGKADENPERG